MAKRGTRNDRLAYWTAHRAEPGECKPLTVSSASTAGPWKPHEGGGANMDTETMAPASDARGEGEKR